MFLVKLAADESVTRSVKNTDLLARLSIWQNSTNTLLLLSGGVRQGDTARLIDVNYARQLFFQVQLELCDIKSFLALLDRNSDLVFGVFHGLHNHMASIFLDWLINGNHFAIHLL